jgi:acyl-coenzyme A synthetase/AMP-(fatty) acid ligase
LNADRLQSIVSRHVRKGRGSKTAIRYREARLTCAEVHEFEAALAFAPPDSGAPLAEADGLAHGLFSSGTRGAPNGIVHRHTDILPERFRIP